MPHTSYTKDGKLPEGKTSIACGNPCQFLAWKPKEQGHVCSIGIICPGSDCNFRKWNKGDVYGYLNSLEEKK